LGPPEVIPAILTHTEIASEPALEKVGVELVEAYPETMTPVSLPESQEVSLCEALDRILNKGAVLLGEVIISVADIDLVFLGLQVILASMETIRGFNGPGGKTAGLEPYHFGVCR
jgi:hypothetical protein